MKKITLSDLARILNGRLEGEGNPELTGIMPIELAREGQITFLSGAKNYSKHLASLEKAEASAVIAPEDAPELPLPSIRLENSYLGLVKALEYFNPEVRPEAGIHPTAFVHEDARVSASAIVGPLAVVEKDAQVEDGAWVQAKTYVGPQARIGKNSRIYPGAAIMHECQVGENCIIHSGTVIGSDGFGFTRVEGIHLKVPQVGNVIVENDVEIGANVTVDRGTMGPTVIGEGTKIDNMVQIAHNCVIGKRCIIVAQVGISGSTILEDDVTLAGQSGTVGHVTVGRGTTVAARGVVTNNVAPGSFVSGFPIKPHQEERRILASLRRLPELVKKVKELEKKLETK